MGGNTKDNLGSDFLEVLFYCVPEYSISKFRGILTNVKILTKNNDVLELAPLSSGANKALIGNERFQNNTAFNLGLQFRNKLDCSH